jgi:hypothetical protein
MQGSCPCALRLIATDLTKGIGRKVVRCGSEGPTGTPIEMRMFWGKEHERSSAVVTPR